MLAQMIPTSTDDERRSFYQRRLALFAQIFLWLFVAIIIWVNGIYELFPLMRVEHYVAINCVAVAGIVLLWLLHRMVFTGREISVEALFTWDVILSWLAAAVLGITALLAKERPINVFSVFIWTNFMVFARVCIIPSSGMRTLFVALGSFIPLSVTAVVIAMQQPTYVGTPVVAFAAGFVTYSVMAALLAALGSKVIYGLRLRIRAAQQLGQYSLIEKIGEGGMGTVYKAQHAMLRRPTALKLLKPEMAQADALARFEREVQLTSELTHPNTVAIFDYGRSPDGVFYYTMEYLDGIDLDRLVRRYGPQPASRVIHIVEQVCGALMEAHGRGLVHRDIKPGNVILCRRGNVPDVAKVLDFGLVKDLSSKDSTAINVLAGTPAYLAPEAVKDPETMGPSGDLYAVGAMAYYLLTGETVFSAKNVLEMCVHHVNTKPTPPSERVKVVVPEELEALIMQCLRKTPSERPANARLVRDRLLAMSEAYPWSMRDAEKWWRNFESSDGKRAAGQGKVSDGHKSMTVDLEGRAPTSTRGFEDTILGV
jgi:serine/threonine-protein kinase